MRRTRDGVGYGILASAYAGITIVTWHASRPYPFGDTYRYFGSTLWEIQNPGVTPVLVYTSLTEPGRVVAFQVFLYACVWALLAGLVLWRLRTTWVRWPLSALTLLASLTAPLWSWNTLLGSESVTISVAVLWMSSLVWIAGHRSKVLYPLILNSLGSALLLATRPTVMPVVLCVEIIVCIWAWRRAVPRWMSLPAVMFVLMFSVYSLVRLQLLASDNTYRFRYAVDNYVDKTTSFRAFADANMPKCPSLSAAVNGPRPWDDVWQLKEKLISVCPETFIWLRAPGTSFLSWAFQIPLEAMENAAGALPSVRFELYTPTRALPEPVDNALSLHGSPWIALVIALTVGTVLAWGAGVRIHVRLAWILGAVAIAVSVAAALVLIWGADGIELSRHLVPLISLLPVAALVLPATLPSRRRLMNAYPQLPAP